MSTVYSIFIQASLSFKFKFKNNIGMNRAGKDIIPIYLEKRHNKKNTLSIYLFMLAKVKGHEMFAMTAHFCFYE